MGNVPACSTPHSARGPCRGMPRIRGNHPGTSRRPPARRPLPLAYWRCLHLSSCCPPGSLACPRKQAAALPPPARPGPQAVTPGTLTWRRGLRGTTGVRSPDAGSLLAQRFACVGFGASVLDRICAAARRPSPLQGLEHAEPRILFLSRWFHTVQARSLLVPETESVVNREGKHS